LIIPSDTVYINVTRLQYREAHSQG
jgi:hypothetical protein